MHFTAGSGMTLKDLKLGNIFVGESHPPFVIAEMSGNHNQSLERALAIVEAAAASGVQALKIQTYTADTMTLDCRGEGFTITDPNSLWRGESLYQLYQKAHTPWDWHEKIFKRCRDLGIIGFSTPFDETAVDFLESLNVPFYKIASFENTDIPLIKRVAKTKKPVIMSTGMATLEELNESIKAARDAGCQDLILLKCTSTYPASPKNCNLNTIAVMRETLKCQVGLSDHTMGIGVAVASVTLGVRVIEKHFTLRRSDGGVDSTFSLEPHEMKTLVEETCKAWQAIGQARFGPTENEKKSLLFRRSIYITKDLKAGDTLDRSNIRCIRPGLGLAPKYFEDVIGKKIVKDAGAGTPLSPEMLESGMKGISHE